MKNTQQMCFKFYLSQKKHCYLQLVLLGILKDLLYISKLNPLGVPNPALRNEKGDLKTRELSLTRLSSGKTGLLKYSWPQSCVTVQNKNSKLKINANNFRDIDPELPAGLDSRAARGQ